MQVTLIGCWYLMKVDAAHCLNCCSENLRWKAFLVFARICSVLGCYSLSIQVALPPSFDL